MEDKYTTFELATVQEALILADLQQLSEDAGDAKEAIDLVDSLHNRETKILNRYKIVRKILDSAAHQQDIVRFREWEVIVKHQEGQFDRLIEQGDKIIELLTTQERQ